MGLIEDHLFMLSTIFSVALLLVIGVYVIGALLSYPQFQSPTATIVQRNFLLLDNLMIVLIVLLCIVEMVLAYFIPSHPLFFISYLALIVVTFILAPIYTNLYTIVATTPILGPSAQQLPFAAQVMNNLPVISLIFGALAAFVTYAKNNRGNFSELR